MNVDKNNKLISSNKKKTGKDKITPVYCTNSITAIKTLPDGNCENIQEENAAFAKKAVDENHK